VVSLGLKRVGLGLLACLFLLGIDFAQRGAVPVAARAAQLQSPQATPFNLVLKAQGVLPMPIDTPAAHASNLLALPAAHPASMMAFWFAGERESAPNVQIAQSQFDRATQKWTPARFVVNRHTVGDQLGFGLRRLGNPVAWLDAQGKIHLFVVATGLGGWAAGRIVHLVQNNGTDDAHALSFAPVRVLPLSWLWNTSFLARIAPMPLADGGMVLPVYFELGRKYPVALRFDAQGEFKGMTRISSRPNLLQPTLLPVGESSWLALMRDNSLSGYVAAARTDDGGVSWRDVPNLALINPDASIAGLALSPQHLVLAHNASPGNRNVLDLSQSHNGVDWTLLHTLARGDGKAEFSYPAMAWADGNLWVTYTDHRKVIAWQRFADAAAP
jgi:predicted neuraminidase